ncbi:MAG: leucine-rich repeat domain-containing protein [Oscillospiraceae bacterium]|nr:leucine-rich repeat domain-containing protein [Oscillospiraceae bacterium]
MKNKKVFKKFVEVSAFSIVGISMFSTYVVSNSGKEIPEENISENISEEDSEEYMSEEEIEEEIRMLQEREKRKRRWMYGDYEYQDKRKFDTEIIKYLKEPIVDVIYNNNSRYYEGAGLRFRILNQSEAEIVRPINFENEFNKDLETINIAAIRFCGLEYKVTEVSAVAFFKCENLKKVTLPNVRKIGQEVFIGCKKLETIELPKLEVVGSNLFLGCNKLNFLNLSYGFVIDTLSQFDKQKIKNINLNLLGENIEIYELQYIKYKLDHRNKTAKIVEATRRNKISGILNINKILIHNNEYKITEIENRAFFLCENIKKLIISNNVKSIGVGAFLGCSGLKEATVAGSVEFIKPGTFSNCKYLEKITIDEGIKIIGDGVFCFCNNLKNITIPKSVKVIGEGTFLDCNIEVNLQNREAYIDETFTNIYSGTLSRGPDQEIYIK